MPPARNPGFAISCSKSQQKSNKTPKDNCLMPANVTEIEKRLWSAADQLRANSHLKSSEYSVPVLGLIFLRYADVKFAHADEQLRLKFAKKRRGIMREDYQEMSVVYLPEAARWDHLLHLPGGMDLGK